MRQLVEEIAVLPADPSAQPAEDLIQEVRRRILRARQRNVAIALLVSTGIIANVLASGGQVASAAQTKATTALGIAATAPAQVVVASGATFVSGGHGIDWFSSDGMTVVQTNYSSSGNVVSVVRKTYYAKGQTITWQSTAVFPQQRDWASNTTSSHCPQSCSQSLMFNIYFATVAWNQHLLSTRQFAVVGKPIRLDGRTVVRIESTGVQTPGTNQNEQKIYIDPSDDEIVEEVVAVVPPPDVRTTTYRWLPAAESNLAHLQLKVPARYRRVANMYAAASLDPRSPSNSTPTSHRRNVVPRLVLLDSRRVIPL